MAEIGDNAFVETNGTSWAEVLSSPPKNTRRLIVRLNIYNADTAQVALLDAAIYDGATYWIQDTLSTIPVSESLPFANLEKPWVLKYGQTLCVKRDAAKTTNECQATAHFVDEISEGEREID